MAMDKIREYYQKQKEQEKEEPSQYIEREKVRKEPPQKSVHSIRHERYGK